MIAYRADVPVCLHALRANIFRPFFPPAGKVDKQRGGLSN
jgi:hypothetical protein